MIVTDFFRPTQMQRDEKQRKEDQAHQRKKNNP